MTDQQCLEHLEKKTGKLMEILAMRTVTESTSEKRHRRSKSATIKSVEVTTVTAEYPIHYLSLGLGVFAGLCSAYTIHFIYRMYMGTIYAYVFRRFSQAVNTDQNNKLF